MVAWWWADAGVVDRRGGRLHHVQEALARLRALPRPPMLKLPVIGKILHQSAIARFARTLAVTFKAGVPLVEALDITWPAPPATPSTRGGQAHPRRRGGGLPAQHGDEAGRNLFPHMVVQMTAIGEEAGALDTMLFKVAEFYEMEVNNAVDALASLLEPLIMVIIGVMVGSMVVAMYLPIFKLAATSDRMIDGIPRPEPRPRLPAAAAFGLLLGSFLNVVILRLPRRLEWQWRRTARESSESRRSYDPPPPGIVVEPRTARTASTSCRGSRTSRCSAGWRCAASAAIAARASRCSTRRRIADDGAGRCLRVAASASAGGRLRRDAVLLPPGRARGHRPAHAPAAGPAHLAAAVARA
jgi:hypothetical protein